MTIGIDIRVLGAKHKSGVQEYTENLLEHLLPLDPAIKYKLFYSSFKGELPDYPWLHLEDVELKKFKTPNKLLFYGARFFNYPKIDRLLGGVDVFFSPHFFLAPLSPHVRRVTTYHDLSYERFPEFFSWRKKIWHKLEMRPQRQAQTSDRIIAVSDSTANDLVELYNIDPTKIKRIYSGISSKIRKINQENLDNFRAEHNLPNQFILFVGTLEPRKNVVGLIKAFNQIKDMLEFEDLYLVLAGPIGWLYQDIFREVKDSAYKDKIRWVDYVDDRDRAYYYNLASVLVYPSFFEGFGFPPLEAFKVGTPVITSNKSSLPEVVADAGIMIDPYNVSSIAQAIKHALTDQKLRDNLIQKGLARAEQFSWQKCAQETLRVLTSQ